MQLHLQSFAVSFGGITHLNKIIFKEISLKNKNCHHLLVLMSFQICMTCFLLKNPNVCYDSKVLDKIYKMFFKEASAHQGCIYLIKNTVNKKAKFQM